jgi:anti-sigma regulatory factor (Ser/Thr protein kinase)
MAEIRTALRAYLLEGHPLPEVISLLNDLLISMGRNRSATAAILELDLESSEIEAVSAGHLPVLMVEPGGEAAFLDGPQGLPLGVSSTGEYLRHRHPFPDGTVLLLYTDGLVERRGELLDLGLERLRRAAADAVTVEESSLADRVYAAMLGDVDLDDDVALLTVEALPLGERMEIVLEAHPGVLAGLRRTIGRWLIGKGVGEGELFDITLAASEAAGNAIEHAYGIDAATFTVRCERDGDDIRVTVADNGRWRQSRPYGRGRGLAIMRALVDAVDLDRGSSGTTVTLTKHLSSSSR